MLFNPRFLLHFTVFLYGFTAIIGKLLDLNTFSLVWWRMFFSILFFIPFFIYKKDSALFTNKPLIMKLIGIGMIVGIHWYCFYGSVKISHASVGLICMAMTTMFTTIIEPIIFKKPFHKLNFFISILIIPLMYWLVNGIKNFNFIGFIIGIAAAFFAALFSVLNKNMVNEEVSKEKVSFFEFIGVFIFCTPMMIYLSLKDGFIAHAPFDWKNFGLMMVLSLLCTNLAYVISLFCLKKLSVFETNLIIGLEPVYGIIMAYFLLDEHQYLNINFYLASMLILVLIFLHPWLIRKFDNTPS
jgi:drug/metabolite transporter (DMT)-like permease